MLGSLFGATGAGVAGYKMKKRVGDVEEFAFVPLSPGEGSRLHVTIAVPGWLPPVEDDVECDSDDEGQAAHQMLTRLMQPWDGLIHSHQQYGLQYETKYLAELGEAIKRVYNMAITMAANQLLKMTILHSKAIVYHVTLLFAYIVFLGRLNGGRGPTSNGKNTALAAKSEEAR